MQRKSFVTSRSFAVAIAITMAIAAGANEQVFQIVRVKGRFVHIRSDVPPALTHDNVLGHISGDEVWFMDQMAFGVDYRGKPGGAWCHLINATTGEAGWVSEHYVTALSEPFVISERREAPVLPSVDTPESRLSDDLPVAEIDLAEKLSSLVVNCGTLLLALLTVVGLRGMVLRVRGLAEEQGVVNAPHRVPVTNSAQPALPNFIYGSTWRISASRTACS